MRGPSLLRKATRVIGNALTMWALRLGIPRPPYSRGNALIVETVGRRSGKRYRIPVGYVDEGGKIYIVVEDGARADWVRNALAQEGRLRVHLRGRWRQARLLLLEGDPQDYLERMNRVHAALVRWHSTSSQVAELTLE